MASKVVKPCPPPPPAFSPSPAPPARSPSIKRAKAAREENEQEARSAIHKAICSGTYKLKPAETRVSIDRVVGEKREGRPIQLGSVYNIEKHAPSPVAEAMWARIRYGPSALENPKIRSAIVGNTFSLRSVETRYSSSPVVFEAEKATAGSSVLKEMLSFDRATLKQVESRVSRIPVIGEQGLSKEMKEAIKRFPTVQLNHVVPRIYGHIVVTKGHPIVECVRKFDRKTLKKTETVEKKAIQVVVKDEEEKEEAKDAPVEIKIAPLQPATGKLDAKLLLANISTLQELGFTDKKLALTVLRDNGNDLVQAVEQLLALTSKSALSS